MITTPFALGAIAICGWLYTSAPCPGVIGVVYNQHGVVRDVYNGSPAAAMGIKLNDKILDRKSTRGKPGTIAEVKFIRDGKLHKVNIPRVCVDKLDERTW